MKEVIILILLLTLFQTFVLLYCQNTTKNCNCKQTENYTPPPSKTDCYSKDVNGNLVVNQYGKLDSRGNPSYNPDCHCVSNPGDFTNCPPDKL